MGCGSSTEQSGAVHSKPQAKVYPQQQVSDERQHIIIIFATIYFYITVTVVSWTKFVVMRHLFSP